MSAVYENHLDLLYSVGGTSKITWLTVPVTSWSAPNILAYSWNQMQFYNLRIQDEHGGGGVSYPPSAVFMILDGCYTWQHSSTFTHWLLLHEWWLHCFG